MSFNTYFNFNTTPNSIYPYAPVYRHHLLDQEVIIKKTKSDTKKLEALFKWQNHLVSQGIKTLTPMLYKNRYFHPFETINWVVYPFIEGEDYTGSKNEIQRAGDLLGRLHQASNTHYFEQGFTFEDYDDDFFDEVKDDLVKITQNYPEESSTRLVQNNFQKINELIGKELVNIKEIKLPYIDGHWDYKASNLIFNDTEITLIDTDNAGHIPRLFDLALALLLFHTSEEKAPNRPFTPNEWSLFYKAYSQHIKLTSEEIAIWPDYLMFVYLDEVLWAINDLEADESQRQKDLMRSLVTFNFENYPLSCI